MGSVIKFNNILTKKTNQKLVKPKNYFTFGNGKLNLTTNLKITMETFNLTSYENGRIIKTIKAQNMQEAKNLLETKGYDCQDDYFLETVTERNLTDSRNINGRTLYIDEER